MCFGLHLIGQGTITDKHLTDSIVGGGGGNCDRLKKILPFGCYF